MHRVFQSLTVRRRREGLTLVEILVSIAVLALLLLVLMSVINSTSSTVQKATARVDAFASARAAFDLLSDSLAQATLNTYWDYYDAGGNRRTATSVNFVPATYGRASDLQFLVLQNSQNASYGQEVYFETPLAYSTTANYRETQGMLNACGFFVRYGSDEDFVPTLMTQANPVTHVAPAYRWRYRLMEALQDTTQFQVYQQAPNDQQTWATSSASGNTALSSIGQPLADNVIALIVWPRLPVVQDATGSALTANYLYDSQANTGKNPQPVTANQLPPMVQVTIVAIDEASAVKIDTHSATPPAVIEQALQGKFTTSDVSHYQADLYGDGTAGNGGLIGTLAQHHINCRVINSTIVLRESKWSQ